MTEQIIFGESVKDLERFTGKTEDELWAAGFNLDDMDCWCAVEYPHGKVAKGEWGNEYERDENAPYYLVRLLDDWDSYCVGYSVAELAPYVFFTLHHA